MHSLHPIESIIRRAESLFEPNTFRNFALSLASSSSTCTMTLTQSLPIDLTYLSTSLQQDADLREKVRDAVKVIEKDQRVLQAILNRVHSLSKEQVQQLLDQIEPILPHLRESIRILADLIPKDQFYRYNDQFSRTLQQLSYLIVLKQFLQDGKIVKKEQVGVQLGIKEEWKDHFFLPTEEYLHSLISLLNELSRLAVNRVTLGDYESPVQFSQFAKELSTAFGLLNLKNDSLRKRFDSIKYDLKKLEEVVYDLSLRGLLKQPTTAPANEEDGNEGRQNKKMKMDVA